MLQKSFHAGWCVVMPDGVSMGGIQSPEDQEELDELAVLLLEHLRTAPSFRYALVGVEVDSFREYEEIDRDLVNLDFNGLVISTDIWRRLGQPPMFKPFDKGHVWRPFVKVG